MLDSNSCFRTMSKCFQGLVLGVFSNADSLVLPLQHHSLGPRLGLQAGQHWAFPWCFSPQSCNCFEKEGFTCEEIEVGNDWHTVTGQELLLPLPEVLSVAGAQAARLAVGMVASGDNMASNG